eukprot:2269089-Prymnesium_polylepis.1
MLTEASAGAPVAAHVTGNGELATAPPTITAEKKAPRRDSNPRALRSGASELTTTLPERRVPNARRKHLLFALSDRPVCQRTQVAQRTMPTPTCSQRPTTTPTSRRPAAGVARTRSPLGLARRLDAKARSL